jgi:hypothetical protein
MNILGFWNESSEFPLFLMGKFASTHECVGLRARFRNELCSQTKVPPYLKHEVSGTEFCLRHQVEPTQFDPRDSTWRFHQNPVSKRRVLNKIRIMNNVQNCYSYINMPQSQTYISYLFCWAQLLESVPISTVQNKNCMIRNVGRTDH